MVLVQKEVQKVYLGSTQVRPTIPATAISLNQSSIALTTVGQTYQLTATLTPADSTSKVTWSSSNTSIATVDNTGLVTCVTPGSCIITATTDNGLSASCSVALPKELCFTAKTANTQIFIQKNGSPTTVTLETSTDGTNWSTYTMGSTITLSNIGDKVYWRNTSTTTTGFSTSTSNYYRFYCGSGTFEASGDVTYLINKNGTKTLTAQYQLCRLFAQCTGLLKAPELPATTLTVGCYESMFVSCTNLTTCPQLPATTLSNRCYNGMFNGCTSLSQLPKLSATYLNQYCYNSMFSGCSSIKLSTTKASIYQTEYRIPTTGTASSQSYAVNNMFSNTGGAWIGSPTIGQTYYTSNTVV